MRSMAAASAAAEALPVAPSHSCAADPDKHPHLPDPRPKPAVDAGINVQKYVQVRTNSVRVPTTLCSAGFVARWGQVESVRTGLVCSLPRALL